MKGEEEEIRGRKGESERNSGRVGSQGQNRNWLCRMS